MARKFFYVCAGLSLLAFCYHLGAGTATAQGAGNPVVGGFQGQGPIGIVTANGDVQWFRSSDGRTGTWTFGSNVFAGTGLSPSGDPVVAAWSGASGDWAATANGDVFLGGVQGPWVFVGNAFSGGATPALRESWGQLKARFR
jgi:hypothetical protein